MGTKHVYCRNGHEIATISLADYGYDEGPEPIECPYCDNTDFASYIETSCFDVDECGCYEYGDTLVSYASARLEEVVVKVPVFDVEQLFRIRDMQNELAGVEHYAVS
jgi:hypothetical protein